jgi:NIPSNAP
MKRRTFLGTTLAGAVASAVRATAGERVLAGDQAGMNAAPEYYLWRQYILRNGTQPRRLNEYLENAAIPALNRLGHSPIGVFSIVAGVPGPTAFVLTPLPTLDTLGTLERRLAADDAYMKAAAAYLDATATDPPYVRQEVSLLAAFDKFPRLVVPAQKAAGKPRLFELRTYESPTELAHLKKVRMFEELGEIEIFKRVGLTPVFFSHTIAGPRMPSLVYMLVYDDMAAREANWRAFATDPEWRKVAGTPGYSDADIVSNITSLYLRPAAFSQV